MIIRPERELVKRIVLGIREYTKGICPVVIGMSGGIDSFVTATLARQAMGPENVVGIWRGINSAPKHLIDAHEQAQVLGIDLIKIDITDEFWSIVNKIEKEYKRLKRFWLNEDDPRAKEEGWQNAYASKRSRSTTPLLGFISKTMDHGRGLILGTGNAEEDMLLRYFDKFGDGAADFFPINGLLKFEVKKLALYLGTLFEDKELFEYTAEKIPSADLNANGDDHNDETELLEMAHKMGYLNARVTYGDCERGGTIAWVIEQHQKYGVVIGSDLSVKELMFIHKYEFWQAETICFVRKMEETTRHKDFKIPGIPRDLLIKEGYVK